MLHFAGKLFFIIFYNFLYQLLPILYASFLLQSLKTRRKLRDTHESRLNSVLLEKDLV
jgi:hypothetical protein